MSVLVTGVAGFIGSHVVERLLLRGETVVGVDSLDGEFVPLKQARLARLQGRAGFHFHRVDIADQPGVETLAAEAAGAGRPIRRIVHLAALAGVRRSLEAPLRYVQTNLYGHTVILELARRLPGIEHMVYASSSSVYGGNTKLPFAEADRVDTPVSVYAATKRADELLSYSYAHLYRVPLSGLRFFTVYGPWGRPDMAAYIFARNILAGEPIPVFNGGDMARDFTYIDDIVAGIMGILDRPPTDRGAPGAPHCLFNIGNHQSEPLMRFIGVLEQALGRKAIMDFQPMQPGDVKASYADIDGIHAAVGYQPTTPIDVGLPRFVAWYREYHKV
ncbi:MAG: NAD-dependent epimerase/dehydratase family protein [Alphaproteobacteria bacterium]|nr:NAD-dependent epimerase/dehydratase family protein [Alphaproteobacteria bacterium]